MNIILRYPLRVVRSTLCKVSFSLAKKKWSEALSEQRKHFTAFNKTIKAHSADSKLSISPSKPAARSCVLFTTPWLDGLQLSATIECCVLSERA